MVEKKKRKHKCQCNGSGTALSAERDGGRRLNRPERKKARLKVANIVSVISLMNSELLLDFHSLLTV